MDENPAFEFITKPELYGVIPEPEPAGHEIPKWYKQLPVESDGGVERTSLKNSTVRACMPFLEALKLGWIIRLPADLEIKSTEDDFSSRSLFNEDVVDRFAAQQVGRAFPESGHLINFQSHWRVNAPDGWSFLLTHPMNRPGEERFRGFSGILDIDKYDASLNQPAIFLDQDFEGIIKKGTPIQQVIPIHRDWLDMSSVARAATQDEHLDMVRQHRSQQSNQRYYRDEQWETLDPARVRSDNESDGWDKVGDE